MSLGKLESKIVAVVEDVLPSVVSVYTTVLTRIDLFRVAPVQGMGSGVIVEEDGIIITNAHVVRKAQKIGLQLHGGNKMDAKILGMMKGLDIAILKVNETDLDPITIGESNTLKVGQFAIAVGNPLGLGESVTFGLVSALNRTISAQNAMLEGLIQTTAEINPGNSGGALVNTNAELIGIPTAVIPFSQGIGFAIAIDSVRGLLEEFRETGKVSTPWIGITGYTINPRIANYYQLTQDKGALIIQVPNGPAKKAGIKPNDIIVGVNDEEINSIQLLIQKIVKRRIGEEVKIKYIRNGRTFETYVKLSKAPT
ncbi:MAG: trypsin-like peptidase domain-containing protein [Candidatus Heimdallarchaeota archaeon]|nr:trypsin-like peptidase domain-containing protein [Candidatus Heimdallarchaeota archaeon]